MFEGDAKYAWWSGGNPARWTELGLPAPPLGEADYADAHTRYHAFCFAITFDGPIVHQPAEVEWGAWVTAGRLLEMLDELPFVPDSTTLLRAWVEQQALSG